MRKKSQPVPRSADKAYVKAARPFPFSIVAAMPLTISLKQHPAFIKIYFDRYLNFILILIELRLFWPKLHKKCLFLRKKASLRPPSRTYENAGRFLPDAYSPLPAQERLEGKPFFPFAEGGIDCRRHVGRIAASAHLCIRLTPPHCSAVFTKGGQA